MTRKKKKKRSIDRMGWGIEKAEEEIVAEALKIKEMDTGRVELIERDTATPVIETYDEDTGELEGYIVLKNGNREGLLALVKIIEEVNVKQDHFATINSFIFNGKIIVENPSKVDRLWDIDVSLENIGSTDLISKDISISELGTEPPDNIESREFKITKDIKNLFLVKEFINTNPNTDDVLIINDIEKELLKLKDKKIDVYAKANKPSKKEPEAEEEEEEEISGKTWGDEDALGETGLESFGISIDKENVVHFAIALRTMFDNLVSNIKVVKNIPSNFTNPTILYTTEGRAIVEGNQLIWTIDKLHPEYTVLLKFTCNITVSDIAKRRTGTIDVTYQAAASFAEGLAIDKFDAYTRNKFYVDTVNRDEEPGVWDCKLVFDNISEFIIQLFNADVYSPEDESKKFVDIDPNDTPLLPSGAQWHSMKWEFESEDFPVFRKELEFRVMPDFQRFVLGRINISDAEIWPPIKRSTIIEMLDKVKNMVNVGEFSKSVDLLKSIIFKAKISKFEDIIKIAQKKLKAIKELETKKKSLEKLLSKIKGKIQEKTISETIKELKSIIDDSKAYNFKEILYTARDLLNFYDKILNTKDLIEKHQISKAKIELNEIISEAKTQNYEDIINQANLLLDLCKKLGEKETIKQIKNSIEDLIKEDKFETALKELNDLKLIARKNNLEDTMDWVEQKLDLCTKLNEEKIRMEKMNIIKKTILDLGTKFGRLQIMEIAEVCSIKEEQLIIDTIKEMINNKEIYAQYFSSTKSIAFDQQANIEEIDNLMRTYKEWEDRKVEKK